MDSFGVPVSKIDNNQIIFPSICHHPSDFMEHKSKLYYYIHSRSFYCFVCNFSGDIFGLIQHIQSYDFKQSIEYVCSVCGIDATALDTNKIDNWRYMKKYLPNYQPESDDIKIYDESILCLFNPVPHISWINDGISASVLQKFGVGWYPRNNQITIPVRNENGKLIGIHARNTRKEAVENGYKYVPTKSLNDDYRFPTGSVLYGLHEQMDKIQSGYPIVLFESPKSALQLASFGTNEVGLGLFGWNCNKRRRDILLNLGVKEINIALDKQYHAVNDEEWDLYKKQVIKIANLFKPYMDVYTIYDDGELLDYKCSPTDKGRKVWEELWNKRWKMKS